MSYGLSRMPIIINADHNSRPDKGASQGAAPGASRSIRDHLRVPGVLFLLFVACETWTSLNANYNSGLQQGASKGSPYFPGGGTRCGMHIPVSIMIT